MSATADTLVIDARPRTDLGLLASAIVSGSPVLTQILETAASSANHLTIHARLDEHDSIRPLIPESLRSRVTLKVGPPPQGATLLRTDRLYDPKRLRTVLLRNGDPESAVVWRLDSVASLAGAEDELLRRRSYQPIGRFWAFAPAHFLAQQLKHTLVRPNAVTLAAAACVVIAAALVGFAATSAAVSVTASIFLAAGLVLDTADGHLARIQGTASPFGRWLDATLDETCDMLLHAAIAWGAYQASADVSWLVLGMLYAMGKLAFFTATVPTTEERPGLAAVERPLRKVPLVLAIQSAVRLLGHADIRWHLWIVCAATGRLRYELIAFTAYYPIRLALLTARKVAARAS
jgi:phosphatidylglycerophosphate synthase